MNQPHSHCMSHDLQISCATSILDIDADTDEDSDWMETGSSFSFHGNDITEEVAEEYITGESLDIAKETLPHQLLQFFFLIVPSYFSSILVVYLLGEVDIFTPILRIFSFVPNLPFVSLTFSRT